MLVDNLPEELVRKIFSYFTDAEIYFKFRSINQQLREYSDNYVQLGKPSYNDRVLYKNPTNEARDN